MMKQRRVAVSLLGFEAWASRMGAAIRLTATGATRRPNRRRQRHGRRWAGLPIEMLEDRRMLAGYAELASAEGEFMTSLSAVLTDGHLTITDTAARDNSLTVRVADNGTDLEIAEVHESFIAAPDGGVLSNNQMTLTIPLAAVTALTIDTAGGDDLVTVQFDQGNPLPSNAMTYVGGGGTGDGLLLVGGSAFYMDYSFGAEGSGNLTMVQYGTIYFQEVESIEDRGHSESISFHFASSDQVVLQDDITVSPYHASPLEGVGELRRSESHVVYFNNPSNSLSLTHAALGTGSLAVGTLDPLFAARVTIDGGNNPVEVIGEVGAVTPPHAVSIQGGGDVVIHEGITAGRGGIQVVLDNSATLRIEGPLHTATLLDLDDSNVGIWLEASVIHVDAEVRTGTASLRSVGINVSADEDLFLNAPVATGDVLSPPETFADYAISGAISLVAGRDVYLHADVTTGVVSVPPDSPGTYALSGGIGITTDLYPYDEFPSGSVIGDENGRLLTGRVDHQAGGSAISGLVGIAAQTGEVRLAAVDAIVTGDAVSALVEETQHATATGDITIRARDGISSDGAGGRLSVVLGTAQASNYAGFDDAVHGELNFGWEESDNSTINSSESLGGDIFITSSQPLFVGSILTDSDSRQTVELETTAGLLDLRIGATSETILHGMAGDNVTFAAPGGLIDGSGTVHQSFPLQFGDGSLTLIADYLFLQSDRWIFQPATVEPNSIRGTGVLTLSDGAVPFAGHPFLTIRDLLAFSDTWSEVRFGDFPPFIYEFAEATEFPYGLTLVGGTTRILSNPNVPWLDPGRAVVSGEVGIAFTDLEVDFGRHIPWTGEVLTIIDNDGDDPVLGQFRNLQEGATFVTPIGTELQISYFGGDGNDVTLTVVRSGGVTLSGRSFHDVGREELPSEIERAGINGWDIAVWDMPTGEPVRSVTTFSFDANGDSRIDPVTETGFYVVPDLPAGRYLVQSFPPDGWRQTFPQTDAGHVVTDGTVVVVDGAYDVTLAPNQSAEHLDFGNFQQATIRGYGFHDRDRNNRRFDDSAEENPWEAIPDPGLAGRTLLLDANGNSQWDEGERTAVTNAAGYYEFTGVDLGTYRIVAIAEPGWSIRGGEEWPQVSVITTSQRFNVDFPEIPLGAIRGYKFHDLNANGIDDNEPRWSGVQITLTDAAERLPPRTVVTNESGEYIFENLWPDTYVVTESPPDGSSPTTATSVTVEVREGEVVTAFAGQSGINASLVRHGFGGTVTSSQGGWQGNVAVTTPLYGSIIYDRSLPDVDSNPARGGYVLLPPVAPTGPSIQIELGGFFSEGGVYRFVNDPDERIAFAIENDYQIVTSLPAEDAFHAGQQSLVLYGERQLPGDFTGSTVRFAFSLQDSTLNAFSNDSLPAALDLTAFDQFVGFIDAYSQSQGWSRIRYDVQHLEVVPPGRYETVQTDLAFGNLLNRPPVANAGGPYTFDLGAPVTLDGSLSTDPDQATGDHITSYLWDLDNDGQFDDASGPNPVLTFSELNALGITVGIFPIHLQVTDTFNATATADTTLTITEIEPPPENPPSITSSADVNVAENSTFVIDVAATDPDGDTENGGGLTFALTGGADEAAFAIVEATGELSFVAPPDFEAHADADGDNVYRVQVTVTDSTGRTGTQDLSVTVTGVDELGAPYDANPSNNQVMPGAAAGTPVGLTVVAIDPEHDAITYQLLDNAGGRFQIGATTGVVTVRAGTVISFPATYSVVVEAASGSLTTSRSFFIGVSRIVDNDDPGYSDSGNWTRWLGQGFAGDVREAAGGGPVEVATYVFTGLSPGAVYQAAATWTPYANRAAQATYNVAGVVGGPTNVVVDQRIAPHGFVDAGAPWDVLGVFTADGTGVMTVRLFGAASGSVIADAVRVDPFTGPEIDVVLDGTLLTSGVSNVSFGDALTNTVASRTFTVRNVGVGNLVLQPLEVTGAFSLASENFVVNQVLPPSSSITFTIAMDTSTIGIKSGSVTLPNNDEGEGLFTFALEGEVVDTLPPPPPIIIDNDTPGYSDSGNLTRWAGQGYRNDIREAPGGTPIEVATYRFQGLEPGEKYLVSSTYVPHSNRATSAAVAVTGVTQPATVYVNQQLAPQDLMDQGIGWKNLGAFTVDTSGTLVVTMQGHATGSVIVDAVRVQRLTGPEIEVFDGALSLGSGLSTVGFGRAFQAAVATKVITVRNDGVSPLVLQPIATTGDFSVVSNFTASQSVAPGQTATFVLSMNTATVGPKSGSLSFATNDANESLFTLSLAGEVVATVVVVDDGDSAGYQDSANMAVWQQGYQGDVREAIAGGALQTATYSFPNLPAGTYRISATWTPYANRASNAPYQINDQDPLLINQKLAPGNPSANPLTGTSVTHGGFTFADLDAAFSLPAGGTITVRVSDAGANGNVIMDAIRIERTGPAPAAFSGASENATQPTALIVVSNPTTTTSSPPTSPLTTLLDADDEAAADSSGFVATKSSTDSEQAAKPPTDATGDEEERDWLAEAFAPSDYESAADAVFADWQ